jgi:glutathione synthase/RimK-type ligase-like ATP-grasp enzyme
MTIAVHFEPTMSADNYAHRWVQYLAEAGVTVRQVNFKEPGIIAKIKDCDAAMWHWYHLPEDKQAAPKILNTIESILGIPVFPNFATRWHFDEKISQYYLLEAIDAPIVPTHIFWEAQAAKDFGAAASYPLVGKLSVGAGSTNVLKLENQAELNGFVDDMINQGVHPYLPKNKRKTSIAKKFINKLLGKPVGDLPHWYYLIQRGYVFLQDYMAGNDYDVRVTVIDGKAFGFIRYNRDNDFRASGSGKINYDLANIPLEAVKIAQEISAKCGFQSMAYDFLHDANGKWLVNEISYSYVNKAVYACPGYWDQELNYHTGSIWPEQLQVELFLRSLKQS